MLLYLSAACLVGSKKKNLDKNKLESRIINGLTWQWHEYICHSLHSQELSSLCFPPIFRNSDGIRDLDAVVALNNIHDLLQLHRRGVGMMEELEVEQLKSSSDLHYQHLTNSRLKVWLCYYIQTN